MIIASAPFVLAALAADNYLYPRIGYENRLRGLPGTSFVASSATDDGPADAISRPDTYSFWGIGELPATNVISFGQMIDLSYVGMAGHTLASCGCTILLESSLDGIVWDPFGASLIPVRNGPLMFFDVLRQASHLRITVSGGLGVLPKIAVIYAGKALVMQRIVEAPYTPINMARDPVLHGDMSEGGQFLGQSVRRSGVKGDASFKYLSAQWVRDYFDAFAESAITHPYFFAWNPEYFPQEIGFCWSIKPIRPVYMGQADHMSVDWEMRGVGYR